MNTTPIQPYNRQGAWISSYRFYFDCAYKLKEEFENTLSSLKKLEQKLRNKNEGTESGLVESYIAHETDELRETAYRHATGSFLFACMTIEGLINDYGTVRLGEKFYKSNLERLGITEKISILLLMCLGIKINKNDPLIKDIRTLFDKRNRLVHPKTKEFNSDRPFDFVTSHPNMLEVDESLQKMECIISCLNKLDPAIRLGLEDNET